MSDRDYVEVIVKEAARDDAGRGIARLSIEIMRDLSLVSGDVIEIQGKRKATAIVWPGFPQDTNQGILRIDGTIRSNAGTGVDERIRIRKAEVGAAKKVVIQPTQPIRLVGGEQYLSRVLRGRSVMEGQKLRVDVIGNPITLVIAKVSPKGIAIVTDETQIELKETPYKPEEGVKEGVSDVHYEDIGGLGRELEMVREMIELPLRHPELFERLGIEPPKGVLLYGPPGTGKTLIAKAVANEVDAHFITLSGPEIMSKYYGESEGKLREVFEEAQENAPTILFIDEIDSIAPRREETKGEVERRVVAQLLSLMDGLKARGQVIVIAATNIPDAIDPALRRGGRFDREIEIGIPDKKGRMEIFQVHTRGVPLAEDVNLEQYADTSHGFVGADIALLVKEAAMHALRKIIPKIDLEEEIPGELLEDLRVTSDDFDQAKRHVEPSAMREVLVEIPSVSWKDVGGLDDVKSELQEAVEWPLKYPDVFEKLKTSPPKGILLFGPPGTGKTLLAKAVANESQVNFISVKGPELLSKWVGESEKGVREIFRKARQASPSIIFFDEVDALVPKRGTYMGSSHVTESVVSQILTELDGLEELKDVTVIGATNRPDMLDPALMRPGRMERHIYVPPPDAEGRKKIFDVYLEDGETILAADVSIDDLVAETEHFVGADIEALVREAKLAAMREFIQVMGDKPEQEITDAAVNVRITRKHFDEAKKKVKGSLDQDTLEASERQAWEMLYNQDQRTILENAAAAIRRAGLQREQEIDTAEIRQATFGRTKDFNEIKRLTSRLEDELKA
ncbi:MAG TPA: CDC48 family AAA ATPase [Methanoregulaceae archaeon]|nr:CDC48 family AAA ATPase [Methanolinea sp.]MDD3091177.1 CDC48 family AAA ATPase [Methanoregulaceae archaeon]HOP67208.1 CDC48 family AAA ATPase [Methanoregulaceae archaeon]HPJ74663.1 CDC48 family AAA ATPase [Methanoregulaceae archaeon]HPQ75959.1 CDC48 family AAA ATPase [Methanoregulaceae archaeon]